MAVHCSESGWIRFYIPSNLELFLGPWQISCPSRNLLVPEKSCGPRVSKNLLSLEKSLGPRNERPNTSWLLAVSNVWIQWNWNRKYKFSFSGTNTRLFKRIWRTKKNEMVNGPGETLIFWWIWLHCLYLYCHNVITETSLRRGTDDIAYWENIFRFLAQNIRHCSHRSSFWGDFYTLSGAFDLIICGQTCLWFLKSYCCNKLFIWTIGFKTCGALLPSMYSSTKHFSNSALDKRRKFANSWWRLYLPQHSRRLWHLEK